MAEFKLIIREDRNGTIAIDVEATPERPTPQVRFLALQALTGVASSLTPTEQHLLHMLVQSKVDLS